MRTLSPSLTSLIRTEHSAVWFAFHRFKTEASVARKTAIARGICAALETHAQLENEILYPAARTLTGPALMDDTILPQTDEVLSRIAGLRVEQPGTPDWDQAFMDLMREALHHVADEETTLLPALDRGLDGELDELGARWVKRRLELTSRLVGDAIRRQPRQARTTALWLGAATLLAALWARRGARARPSLA
jgi:hypothetical protein